MRELVALFTQEGISMPDDAREVIFPQGVPVTMMNNQGQVSQQKAPVKQRPVSKPQTVTEKRSAAHDDVSSENDDIRHQAEEARAGREYFVLACCSLGYNFRSK